MDAEKRHFHDEVASISRPLSGPDHLVAEQGGTDDMDKRHRQIVDRDNGWWWWRGHEMRAGRRRQAREALMAILCGDNGRGGTHGRVWSDARVGKNVQ